MTHVKRLVGLSTALMLVGLTAGTSLAAVPDATKFHHATTHTTQKTEHTTIQTIYGTVSAVTPNAKTVEVTVPWGKADRLIVGATVTEVKEGKTRESLADLKVGEHVRMKFAERVRSAEVAKPIIIKLEKQRG